MSDEADDPVLRNLRRLPVLEPDASRARSVRARCGAAVARRQQAHSPHSASFTTLVLEPVLIGGLCVIYLSAVVLDVLRLHGAR